VNDDPGAEIGGGYWLPGWAVHALHTVPGTPLNAWRREVRTRDPQLYRVLVALCETAIHHDAQTASGQVSAPTTATDPPSRCLTTSQAAERLGVSPRTLRRLIEGGVLHASRPGYGWLIAEEEVNNYRAQRDAA
jgi:excisionase family DNA binding protein